MWECVRVWGVKEWDYVWECEGVECGSMSGMSGSKGMVGREVWECECVG